MYIFSTFAVFLDNFRFLSHMTHVDANYMGSLLEIKKEPEEEARTKLQGEVGEEVYTLVSKGMVKERGEGLSKKIGEMLKKQVYAGNKGVGEICRELEGRYDERGLLKVKEEIKEEQKSIVAHD